MGVSNPRNLGVLLAHSIVGSELPGDRKKSYLLAVQEAHGREFPKFDPQI
jgi:hypothetical protein